MGPPGTKKPYYIGPLRRIGLENHILVYVNIHIKFLHTVVNLDKAEQQELQQRIEAKAKHEQENKAKAKKKGKKEGEPLEREQTE